jgi:hypothetical protein
LSTLKMRHCWFGELFGFAAVTRASESKYEYEYFTSSARRHSGEAITLVEGLNSQTWFCRPVGVHTMMSLPALTPPRLPMSSK